MHKFLLIVIPALVIAACVKPNSDNPVPEIEYKDFRSFKLQGKDSAAFTLGYQDGDGDLFVDYNEQGPNIFITPYFYNKTHDKYLAEFSTFLNDTFRITGTVKQPADGYYKGKSIRGEIIYPTTEFRSGTQKIFKYTIYMKDLSNHKTNVITTPSFTIDF